MSMKKKKPGDRTEARLRTPALPRGGHGLSDRELDARLHDAAVELDAAELPSLARTVQAVRRRLGVLRHRP